MTGIASPRPSTAARTEAYEPAPLAVSARSLSKSFRLPNEPYSSVKDRVLHPLAPRHYEVLPALRDIDLEVRRGESFGIVGRNGSGKSTLLKCIAGIYRADRGTVDVHGRLAPFIELGVGFNADMTARDNALVNAVLLGLSRARAAERLDAIMAFAELEQFADLKLKNFSSGMTVRLAFAITIQVDADVLLFDEVLKVGDEAFQAKCLAHFDRLKAEGRTLLLVTHDMASVERFCDRALLLEAGRVADVGAPAEIARGYHALNAGPAPPRAVISRDQAAEAPSRPERRLLPSPRGAFGRDPRRLLALTRTLAAAQFKVKYMDAALSYLWVLIWPFAFFGILYLVFTRVGSFDRGVSHYPLYLLSALVLWMFFADGTSRSVDCLVRNESLLRRVPIPHLAVPLAVVATALFDLCMSAVAVLAFLLASGVTPRASWLELIPLVGLLTLLITGVSMLLSALYVRYRDVDHVWALLRQFLFYTSAILYAATAIPASLRTVAVANPLAAVNTELRHAVIDPHAPTYVATSGGVVHALAPVAVAVAVFAAGLWVFSRESPTVAENL